MHCQSATEQPGGSWALSCVERRRGAVAAGVVVAGHDHDRLLAAREVPEARQRQVVDRHLRDQVREQALLLVGLRDVHLVEVDPVGHAGIAAHEQVVGADRRKAVAFVALPVRVALPGPDDRAREVVGERGDLAARGADAPQRDRRRARRRGRVRVERRHRRGAVQRPAVGGAVELHRVAGDPGSGARPFATAM